MPNPFGGLPDPFGISKYPMPGTGCDWGCLDSGSGSGGGMGDGPSAGQCVANAVNDYLKKKNLPGEFQVNQAEGNNGSTGYVGGHEGFILTANGLTADQAQQIRDALQACDPKGWFGSCMPPGARFGGGLHLPDPEGISGPYYNADPNNSVTLGESSKGGNTRDPGVHLDGSNPNSGLGGMLGHTVVDGLWAHIVDWFHGTLDHKCNPG